MNTETRVTRWHVLPAKASLFDEQATTVEIDDEAGGEFVKVCQITDATKDGEIRINPEEWPAIREAIDKAVSECRPLPPQSEINPEWRALESSGLPYWEADSTGKINPFPANP